MNLHLRSLFTGLGPAPRSSIRRRRRPWVEDLEDRTVLSSGGSSGVVHDAVTAAHPHAALEVSHGHSMAAMPRHDHTDAAGATVASASAMHHSAASQSVASVGCFHRCEENRQEEAHGLDPFRGSEGAQEGEGSQEAREEDLLDRDRNADAHPASDPATSTPRPEPDADGRGRRHADTDPDFFGEQLGSRPS